MRLEDLENYKDVSDDEQKALQWLQDQKLVEIRDDIIYFTSYASGFMDGINMMKEKQKIKDIR